MRLYFDANIYSFICKCNEGPQFKKFLQQEGHIVLASDSNIFEIYAMPSIYQRSLEAKSFIQVATQFVRKPVSLLHANELFAEIRRCRANWIERKGLIKRKKEFLNGHKQNWYNIKKGILPSYTAYTAFHRGFECGVAKSRSTQKEIRSQFQNGFDEVKLYSPAGDAIPIDVKDPNIFWRADCCMVWHNAIVMQNPSSRDYSDWLTPYLQPGAFNDSSYNRFWLEDVSQEMMVRNQLTSLVNYYQLKHKITHGNSMDQLHANHIFDVDLFFTADHAFFFILEELIKNHFPKITKPVLIDRGACSAFDEICKVLKNYSC